MNAQPEDPRDTGRRDDPDSFVVRVETEVPGTPEQVWETIATGPGIECWFVPAEVEGREGGTITTDHGPFGRSTGTVTVWDPPHRFAYEERDWQPPEAGAPPWATEILVEARAGGTCVVRLASGLFSNAADWADEIAPTEDGWRQGLENLRLYLTHFNGLQCSSLFVLVETDEPAERAWEAMAGGLGLLGAGEGDSLETAVGAPRVRGIVEDERENWLVVRTEEPAPGLLELLAFSFKGPTHVFVRGYLYGDSGADALAREEPVWREWLAERFPSAATRAGTAAEAG
jgi:uncharacterized protein YndB with AHSA1/START domain